MRYDEKIAASGKHQTLPTRRKTLTASKGTMKQGLHIFLIIIGFTSSLPWRGDAASKNTIKQGLHIFWIISGFTSSLSWRGDDDSSRDCDPGNAFVTAIRRGNFSLARLLAQRILQESPLCEKEIRQLYVNEADAYLSKVTFNGTGWESSFGTANVEPRVADTKDCWVWDLTTEDNLLQPDLWSKCCSQLPQPSPRKKDATNPLGSPPEMDECIRDSHRRFCCDFYNGSSSYLHLPLLQELSLRLRVQTDEGSVVFYLEQDGVLRQYDPSAILWPTAYLLSLCVAEPRRCGIPEIFDAAAAHPVSSGTMVVELGTGIGAPAIVLSRSLQAFHNGWTPLVVATDKSRSALALTLSNARAASVSSLLTADELDFSNLAALQAFRNMYGGFAIVLGSSLMSLFDPDKPEPLWQVLDILLDETNPHAIAILAHSVHSVVEAGSGFRLVRRISGSHFGMRTRQEDASDFEISVYARQVATRMDEF